MPVHVLQYQILKYICLRIMRNYFQFIKRSIYQAFCIIVLEWFIFKLCVKILISFHLNIISLKLENVVIHLAEKGYFLVNAAYRYETLHLPPWRAKVLKTLCSYIYKKAWIMFRQFKESYNECLIVHSYDFVTFCHFLMTLVFYF